MIQKNAWSLGRAASPIQSDEEYNIGSQTGLAKVSSVDAPSPQAE